MDLELDGKRALITGGSKGIGKSIAIQLCQEGVKVAIGARTKETLDEAAKEIDMKVPLIVRLAGTNVELGKKMLSDSGLDLITADDMDDGAKKAIQAIGGASWVSGWILIAK